jgi:hypothetical protein
MMKLVRTGLIVTVFGWPLGLGLTGCNDNAGGNEDGVMDKTPGGKGTVAPNTPSTPEEYYKQHRGKR